VRHASVGFVFVFRPGKAPGLAFPCRKHAFANRRRSLGGDIAGKIAELDGGRFDVNIDAVQKRTRDFCAVAFDLRGGASALLFGLPKWPQGYGYIFDGTQEKFTNLCITVFYQYFGKVDAFRF
jgi:hypothetical protein